MRDDIAKKTYLLLIKLILFQVSIQQMLLQLIQNLSNSFYVTFSFIFGIDENVVEIYNNKDIELLC